MAEDWPRFRGPNGTGVSATTSAPTDFGPSTNLAWKVDVPTGHSSPVLLGDRLYLTGEESGKLFTLCLRRSDGKLLWKKEAPRPRRELYDKRNNAASATPAAEPGAVYVFFPDYGLLSYTDSGTERWRLPLGPFDNYYGMGSSPIIAGDTIVLICDQRKNSFALGVNKATGSVRWRTPRAEAVSGHSTPALYQPKQGPLQVVAPGSFRMDAYQASSGEVLWYANGLASEMKSVPVVDGDMVYINGFNMPENDPGKQVAVPEFSEILRGDANKDGRISKDEMPEGRWKAMFEYLDLDHSGVLDEEEWRMFRQSMAAENGLLAIRATGRGDITSSHTVWKFHRAIPQLPSTVLYQGLLYMVNDAGILTVLDPAKGEMRWQGRLRNTADRVYASPVSGAGKVYFVTESGKVVIRRAGVEHEVLGVRELGEDSYATPALADGRLYIRTVKSLYCFR